MQKNSKKSSRVISTLRKIYMNGFLDKDAKMKSEIADILKTDEKLDKKKIKK